MKNPSSSLLYQGFLLSWEMHLIQGRETSGADKLVVANYWYVLVMAREWKYNYIYLNRIIIGVV